ncbi:hypothetical protein BH10PSE13_BH10PSE13_04760 [soil metagenome]
MADPSDFAALLPGDVIPPVELLVDRLALVRYAGAADDYVAQHWDHPFMTGQGYPDVIVHGWLTSAHMCRAVTDWMPPDVAHIGAFAVRYRLPLFPGMLRCGGEVVEADAGQAKLALWARNAGGDTVATASMTLERLFIP